VQGPALPAVTREVAFPRELPRLHTTGRMAVFPALRQKRPEDFQSEAREWNAMITARKRGRVDEGHRPRSSYAASFRSCTTHSTIPVGKLRISLKYLTEFHGIIMSVVRVLIMSESSVSTAGSTNQTHPQRSLSRSQAAGPHATPRSRPKTPFHAPGPSRPISTERQMHRRLTMLS